MAISISRYVSVNSAVIGATVVGVRQLVMNLFTTNPLIPPQTYITFTSAAEVGQYFTTTSEEYYRASSNYFNFISKNNQVPALIQFSRWVNVAVAGSILGYGGNNSLPNWTSITNGSLGLTIGGFTFQLSGLNFSTATSLSAPGPITLNGSLTSGSATVTAISSTASLAIGMAVAGTGISGGTTILTVDSSTQITLSANATTTATEALTFTSAPSVVNILQAAIRAESGGGADWTAATVSYANNNFQLTGGVVGPEIIAVQAGATGTDISGHTRTTGVGQLGWYPQATTANGVFIPGAIISQGSAIETITQTLTNAANASNNFGTFGFLYSNINSNAGLTLSQYQEAANWNYALVPNNMFKLLVPVNSTNASTWGTAYPTGLGGIGGVSLTLTNYVAPVSANTQYPEQCDAAIEAATNYNPGAINSVQNYMYQTFSTLTPLVTTDTQANALDAQHINYIGLTQNAGVQLSFYQRGFLQGNPSTDALDSGVYANEQWLKSAITAQIMNLMLAQNYVAANSQGISQINAVLQSVIQQALLNGTISVGKTLTSQQIADITSLTDNPLAWQQVQNVGYFLLVTIVPSTAHPGELQADYTLIYSKNDVIRFVQGFDDLV